MMPVPGPLLPGPVMTEALLLAAFLAPLAMAVGLATPAAGAVRRGLPLACVPALAAVALLKVPAAVAEPWLLIGAGFGMEADRARVFLGFTAVLWTAAAWAARGWLAHTAQAGRFAVCFLMAMAGNFGLILATDAASFYTFFALMSFASYGLVVHAGTPKALRAARLYIGFVVVGELALFAGLVLAVAQAGTLVLSEIRAAGVSELTAWLLIAGLGVKLGVMPLHVWLPPAHGAAPAAASAVLSGAMIKAGLWGMMAVLPLGTVVLEDHGTVLLAAGLVTLFAAVLAGVREPNPKTVLGWSSVAQMGMVALGIGAALKAPGAWALVGPVLVGLAAHHGLAKGALFLGAGAVAAQGRTGARVVLMVGLAAPALVLAGAAGTSGGWAKEALKAALATGPAGWGPWLTLALTLGGLGTTLLMARFGWTLWRSAGAVGAVTGASGAAVAPFAALTALVLALPLLGPLLGPGHAPDLAGALPDAAAPAGWPLWVGVAVALAVMAGHHAVTVGPAVLWARLIAPARRRALGVRAGAVRTRRAMRMQLRRLPQGLSARAQAWRLAPAVPAGALALVLAVAGAGPLRDALGWGDSDGEAPAVPVVPAPDDARQPGTGLLPTLPTPGAEPPTEMSPPSR